MIKELKREDFVRWGKKSGMKNKKKGKDYFSKMGKKSVKVRKLLRLIKNK